jgi:hypothetical protein
MGGLTQHRVRRENQFAEDQRIFAAPNPVLGYCHASLRDSRMGRMTNVHYGSETLFALAGNPM